MQKTTNHLCQAIDTQKSQMPRRGSPLYRESWHKLCENQHKADIQLVLCCYSRNESLIRHCKAKDRNEKRSDFGFGNHDLNLDRVSLGYFARGKYTHKNTSIPIG